MLKGEKVILREINRDDLARLCQFYNDLEFQVIPGADHRPAPQSLARLEAEYDHRISKGDSDITEFAIEADNVLIGHTELFHFDHISRNCELGVAIGDKNYWGRGYGRDVTRVMLEYAFRHCNMRRVYGALIARNERALRAFTACGFVQEGVLRAHVWNAGAYVDMIYLGILKEEWEVVQGFTETSTAPHTNGQELRGEN